MQSEYYWRYTGNTYSNELDQANNINNLAYNTQET